MTDSESGLPTACTAEHVVPTSWGGCTTQANIKAACYSCNHSRADGAPIHQKSGVKHDRNVRITESSIERQERKRNERMSMWRQSCPVR
jgi:5-methylcytosine-specific restriction endonuclease McrA